MFGIGMPEMILILAVALIVIGPKKLPDLAKSLGKAMGEFKKATSDLKESMQIDTELKDLKNTFDNLEKEDGKPVQTGADGGEDKKPDVEESTTASNDQSQKDRSNDPMDHLKAAFHRQNEQNDRIHTTDSTNQAEMEDVNTRLSDQNADSVSEKPKEV